MTVGFVYVLRRKVEPECHEWRQKEAGDHPGQPPVHVAIIVAGQ